MKTKMKNWIFPIIYLAYTSIYIARINLSVAGPEMIAQGILDTAQLGLLGSVFSSVYATGRLLNGNLSDKKPPQFMLTIGLVFAGLSNIAISFFPPYIGIFLLWTTNAFAQSMLWSSVMCTFSAIYDEEKAKKMGSYAVTSVATGNILSILLNGWLITKFGVAYAFVVPGLLTVLLGGAVCFVTKGIEPAPKVVSKRTPLWQLLKDKEMIMTLFLAITQGVMKENISLWMAVYVVDTYLIDLSTSSYYILMIPAIGFVGRLIFPAVYKLCKNNENLAMGCGFFICLLCTVPLCLGESSVVVAVLCLSFIYAAASVVNTALASVFPMRYVSSGNVGAVSGVTDFVAYLGAGIASAIYGVVIKAFGYLPMFISWIVVSVVSLMVTHTLIKKRASRP